MFPNGYTTLAGCLDLSAQTQVFHRNKLGVQYYRRKTAKPKNLRLQNGSCNSAKPPSRSVRACFQAAGAKQLEDRGARMQEVERYRRGTKALDLGLPLGEPGKLG